MARILAVQIFAAGYFPMVQLLATRQPCFRRHGKFLRAWAPVAGLTRPGGFSRARHGTDESSVDSCRSSATSRGWLRPDLFS